MKTINRTPVSSRAVCRSSEQIPARFCRQMFAAVRKLRTRLRAKYERVFPGRGQLIRQAVSEAEELARSTTFPHLFLPAYAEARVTARIAESERMFAVAA